ncbi:Na(+)/H(+) antiporter subunit F [Andreesenia angusta]|uniref:Na(+)/H(+) antiporter subunit F n=1 Tax=Andreesenia angusta TaxID=39480 RepID=A0A1S1V593_9FIRM|nr:monovalent cation/H+ antiporter complex subunit F [Andreesenia angusta]OHW61718.1 Na(+)/H(+) antiporter subunit F [Andreesenia angusta]
MDEKILISSTIALSITIVICFIRAIKGPELADRLISINVIGTKTIVLISVVSFIIKESYFIDIVLVYALISFLGSVVISNLISEEGKR